MKKPSMVWGLACLAAGLIILVVMSVLTAVEVWGPGSWGPDERCVRARASADVRPAYATDAERAFLGQMIPHHQNAVAMAESALTRAEHPELKVLAEKILRDQTREIEQMADWYRTLFGAEPPSADDRPGGTARPRRGMGMMDHADLEELEAAEDFDREFIEQMIPHHRMGVMMAGMVLGRTGHAELDDLARSIISIQTDEIEQMRQWYRVWYE